MGTPLLSVCVAVRDDPGLLARCLVAAAPVADELVVVLPPSSNGARNVAERLGARVVAAPPGRGGGAALSAALDACHGRWALAMNDDELLEPASRRELEAVLNEIDAPAATVELVAPGPDGDADRAHLPRLVRRGAARYRGASCVTLEPCGGDPCECAADGRERPNGAPAPRWPRSGLRLLGRGPRRAGQVVPATDRERRLLLADLADRPESAEVRLLLAHSVIVGAGGDLLDAPGTRVALALLAPAVERLLDDPGHPFAEPLVALAARIAHVTGDDPLAETWSGRAKASFGATARLLFADAERQMARAARGGRGAARARALFEQVAVAPSGPGAIAVPELLRGARARVRAAACAALEGDAGRVDEALAASTNGERVEALLTQGWVAARADRRERASATIEEAALRDRGDPRVQFARAALALARGRLSEACGAVDRARALAPGWSALIAPRRRRVAGLLAPWTLLLSGP